MGTHWQSVLTDPGSWFWWVGAGILAVIELTAGTFYLLMIALGFLAAGLARLSGASDEVQIGLAAVLALLAVVLLRTIKRRYRDQRGKRAMLTDSGNKDGIEVHGGRDPQRNPAENLDIGAAVYVDAWQGRRARAQYRGAEWNVALDEGVAALPGWYRIVRVEGICLILQSSRSEG